MFLTDTDKDDDEHTRKERKGSRLHKQNITEIDVNFPTYVSEVEKRKVEFQNSEKVFNFRGR